MQWQVPRLTSRCAVEVLQSILLVKHIRTLCQPQLLVNCR